ncbi:MAG: chorismate-binding protein [Muribaculaceae bacterium]
MIDDYIKLAIAKAVECAHPFYAYRLPNSGNVIFRAEGNTADAREVFVAHPFATDAPSHIIYGTLSADEFINAEVIINNDIITAYNSSTTKEEYIELINSTIARIKSGEMHKAVISNTKIIDNILTSEQWVEVFSKLCIKYPSAFVSFFYTKATGFWIGATPEVLVNATGTDFMTMALAGTKLSNPPSNWTEKEIEEHRFVCNYIESILKESNIKFGCTPIFTKNAGHIDHLCKKYICKCKEFSDIKTILETLHPTPALCGLPFSESYNFIKSTEKHDRRLYGGYIGPMVVDSSMYFFVNLRCMQFDRKHICLYAGGGITRDSIPEYEWNEIENKMNTILQIINKL